MSKPSILDWNDGQGYRKITNWKAGVDTNITGGVDDGKVKWLDVDVLTTGANSDTMQYKYTTNPTHMWHLDVKNNDLRVDDGSCINTTANWKTSGCSAQGGSCMPKC
jgi:hypothetical protein